MPWRSELHSLESRVREEGLALSADLKPSLSEQDGAFLEDFFDVNEHGEAVHLIRALIEDHGLLLPASASARLKNITDTQKKIAVLFDENDNQ